MDDSSVDLVLLMSRWLHIAAAIVALGGAFFTRVALTGAAERALSPEAHGQLREAVRRRWAPLVHASIVILLVTGGYNFVVLALPPKIEPLPYHPIFGVKLLAALVIFFLASVLVGRGKGLQGIRQHRGRWLTILLVLGGVVVLISGVLNQVRTSQQLRRGREEPPATARTDQARPLGGARGLNQAGPLAGALGSEEPHDC